jgi:hypothetical protein
VGVLNAFEVLEEVAPSTSPLAARLSDWLDGVSLANGGLPFALPGTDGPGSAPPWTGVDHSRSSLHITSACLRGRSPGRGARSGRRRAPLARPSDRLLPAGQERGRRRPTRAPRLLARARPSPASAALGGGGRRRPGSPSRRAAGGRRMGRPLQGLLAGGGARLARRCDGTRLEDPRGARAPRSRGGWSRPPEPLELSGTDLRHITRGKPGGSPAPCGHGRGVAMGAGRSAPARRRARGRRRPAAPAPGSLRRRGRRAAP